MLEAFGASDPGCVRTNNEDSYLVVPDTGLYLVADGMGGAAAGETASRIATDTLQEILEEEADEGMNPTKLVTAFHEANRRIKAAALQDSKLEGMGTTLVTAVKFGDQMLVASVGDSRAYNYENGAISQITEDQSWVNEIGRRLGLPEDTLKTHPMRHVLTMALGVSEQLKVNLYTVTIAVGALMLICSDGLYNVVTDPEIAQVLNSGGSLERRTKLLIDTARAHGAPDNVTVVLVQHAA
ncbi:MAG: Stp1/IreP family PP2C-type Ser/Thr phosphatase [Bryobacteraceae bacterium]